MKTESRAQPRAADARSGRRWLAIALIALIALAAGGLILVATRDGVSVGPDDAVYAGVAKSIAAGHGPNVPFHMYPLGNVSIGTPPPGQWTPKPTPMVIYAPLQPHVLAIGGDHPVGTAQTEATIFAILSSLLIGAIVISATGELWAAAAAQIIIAFALATGPISGPGTEAFSLVLTLGAFAALLRHLDRPRRLLLLTAAVMIGIATMQRFANGGLIVWAVIALRHRRRDAVLLAAVSGAPLVGWFVYERVSGATTGHSFGFHIVTNTARAAGRSVASWIMPSNTPLPIALVGVLAVVIVVGLVAGRSRLPAARTLLLFAVVQIIVLEIAVTFVDAGVNLEPREFIPVFVAVVLAMACAVGRYPAAKTATLVAASLFVLGGVVTLVNPAHIYAKPYWKHDRVLADVRALPTRTVIYTNAPDAVYLLAHRAVSSVPETRDFSTLEKNKQFTAQIEEIRSTLASRGGYLVYVRGLKRDDFLPTEARLKELLPLQLVRNEPDGAIYSIARAA
jgi:hypothetical protein